MAGQEERRPSCRHDLSTGIPAPSSGGASRERRQQELARGCTAIANNHTTTDRACLAIFALARPAEALARAEFLLQAAAARRPLPRPNERAFALDALISALAEPGSPWETLWRGQTAARSSRSSCASWSSVCPGSWTGPGGARGALEPQVERLRADLEALARRVEGRDRAPRAGRLDPASARSIPGPARALRDQRARPRAGAGARCEWHAARAWVAQHQLLVRARLRARAPRPDLAALAVRLNALESVGPEAQLAVGAPQPVASPAPELWFGNVRARLLREHNARRRPAGWIRT